MSDSGATTQVLGEAGEPCRECGAPLAADQRYCLNCGRRRAEPRIDFRRHVPSGEETRGDEPPIPAQAPGEAAPSSGQLAPRDYTPLAAVGGIAVLGLMLLVGVLIGKGEGGTATAPPPVVVQGGAENAVADEAGATKPEAVQGKPKQDGKGRGKKGAVSGGSANTGNAPVASDAELEQLQEQSPEEYAENSAKLPDEIATGGEPPPEDSKAPGGGSQGTAIE